MDEILQGLNEQQKCAVTSIAPVLQVLAPPGSGKTKTLTTKVAYMIAHLRLQPWNIIVCTFTLKAAREMKQRIEAFIGPELEKKLVLGTFHSICRRYLQNYGHHIGIPKGFGIADSSDTIAILKRLIKRHDFQIEPKKARSRISRRKSNIESPPKQGPPSVEAQEFEQIYDLYEETLRLSNLLDYDDLLLRCVELLRNFPECSSNIQAILVDEFQDTNTVQYELINLIAQHGRTIGSRNPPPSITIVGDPDQSIYSFRSAEIKNLGKMQEKYSETQVIMLSENYRSAGAILDRSMLVIEQDTSRPEKRMQSTHCYGTIPVLRELDNPKQEAIWIVRELQRLIEVTAGLLTYADFAILLRSASLSRLIETELGIAGVPYRMVGGHRFFDRKEVKILLDYMRVVSQPEHSEAMLRVINEPPRKIGDVTVKNLIDHAEKSGWTLWELIRKIVQDDYRFPEKISKQADDGLRLFFNIITRGQKKLESLRPDVDNLSSLLTYISQAIDLEAYLKKESKDKETLENRWENVRELTTQAEAVPIINEETENDESLAEIDGVEQYTVSGAPAALTKFLTNVALATDSQAIEGQTAQDVVTISTIHAAKGLEWPVVFVPALYQGSIPHSRAEDTDEERRLLYVGMTRAQALLYLSWPRQKSIDEAHCLSIFVNNETIRKSFAQKGPSLDSNNGIEELATILRRVCPSAVDIQRARTACHTPYDIALIDDRPAGSRSNENYNTYNQRPQNERSITHPPTFQKTSSVQYQSQPYMAHNSGINTGYQSYHAGFTSAATLKRVPDTLKRSVSDFSASEPEVKKAKAAAERKQKKPAPGQGTIDNFFRRPAGNNKVDDDYFATAVLKPLQKQEGFAKTSNFSSSTSSSIQFNPTPQPTSIPSSFQRGIRSIRSTPTPVDIHEDEVATVATQKYILLSSSPVKPAPDENLNLNARSNTESALSKVTNPNQQGTVLNRVTHARRVGPAGRGMKSWSDIQKEKSAKAALQHGT
jgi:DNA helicase-2/ATP-dependent DNA helicase PcrA